MTIHDKIHQMLLNEEDITDENLSQYDDSGMSGWHYAARGVYFKKIPDNVFTSDALNLIEKRHGRSVWHLAAIHDNLKFIPRRLFTNDIKADNKGETFLHYAASRGILKDIPPYIFTE